MGKKRKKIAKITEEQYIAYVAGLKDGTVPCNSNGDLYIPEQFKAESGDKKRDF